MNDPTPACPKHEWLQRFGTRLLQLQPSLNAVLAAKHAVDTFHDAAHLDPERAAETFAIEDERADGAD